MDPNLLANLLSITLFFVSLFVALRSFALYRELLNNRICILGISMAMIALTAAAGFAGDNVTSITLNVDWFNYIGQTVCFLFIFLSLLRNSDTYLRKLLRYQIFSLVPLVALLLFSPILPPDFPYPVITKMLLSGLRGVICVLILLYYISAFIEKETRFSFLMGMAFLLLCFGYLTILPKYAHPNDLLDHIGDTLRICGLLSMLGAVMGG